MASAPSEGHPLNQFVILAKSAQGKALESLVKQALEHSAIFVFGELLDAPNIQDLAKSPDGSKFLELLRIFAYGTYSDYVAQRSALPELTTEQRKKLQMLTIVSFALKAKSIKYSELLEALELTSYRDLEELIIESIYKGLIVGKMDQQEQCLVIESCTGRDCRPEDLDYIIETLTWWHGSSETVLGGLDGMVQHSRESAERHKAAREELETAVSAKREALKDGDGGANKANSGNTGSGVTRMPSDDADEESKRAKSTRGRWLGMGGGPSSSRKH